MSVSGNESKDEASEKTVFVGRRLGGSRGLNYNAFARDQLNEDVATERQLGRQQRPLRLSRPRKVGGSS
jgi:hypothetical protein